MAKIGTNTSYKLHHSLAKPRQHKWRHLQIYFYQNNDSSYWGYALAWVHCASGNVYIQTGELWPLCNQWMASLWGFFLLGTFRGILRIGTEILDIFYIRVDTGQCYDAPSISHSTQRYNQCDNSWSKSTQRYKCPLTMCMNTLHRPQKHTLWRTSSKNCISLLHSHRRKVLVLVWNRPKQKSEEAHV